MIRSEYPEAIRLPVGIGGGFVLETGANEGAFVGGATTY